MASDPTIEFMAQFDDESKWVIKRRVPLFKPHDRMKVNEKTGAEFVAYSVTRNDMPQIAANMRRNQKKGVPARITVGHVSGDPDHPETDQPMVVGYWLNAEPGTFGPDNEPCVYADAYVKRDCANEVKGRPYRSAEYYPGSKDIRGAALLTRDPRLDLGTVELYRIPDDAYFYSAPGEFYMADEIETKETGMHPISDEPEGYSAWSKGMEHYSKNNPWVGYAMQLYSCATPSATNGGIPGEPEKKEPEMERMQRDDEAINYARLSKEIGELRNELKARDAIIGKITAERDVEQCERMIRTLQAEGYQLKEKTPDLVAKLLKKSPEGRQEWVDMVRELSTPVPTAGSHEIEVYGGPVETDPSKDSPNVPSRKQISELAKRHMGNPAAFDKALAELQNGVAPQN